MYDRQCQQLKINCSALILIILVIIRTYYKPGKDLFPIETVVLIINQTKEF